MLHRVAHMFGFRKKDEALAKRLASLKGRTSDSSRDDIDVVTHMRSNFRLRTVVGAQTSSREQINQSLLASYARTSSFDQEAELVGSAR